MGDRWKLLLYLSSFLLFSCHAKTIYFGDMVTTKTFMFWPNATVPFFINPDQFDFEQSTAIMTALSMFAFKTCLKFAPLMAAPSGNQHVLVFANPDGIRRCVIDTVGHSAFEPHTVTLGYECLHSPDIDMIIMKALGFPFEHNRLSRDLFIDVLLQNVEESAIELFTKDSAWPKELQTLPYDVNSVMHFGEREYSKNGHRTIMFKDRKVHQNRLGLSSTDLRKIEIVYGPECLKRDRQEKIELCQAYPGVARRKREVENPQKQSLRVNPEITAPPLVVDNKNNDKSNVKSYVGDGKNEEDKTKPVTDVSETNNDKTNLTGDVASLKNDSTHGSSASIKELGIEDEVQVIIEHVYKASALALRNARTKYCNVTKTDLRTNTNENSTDILGIVEVIAEYARSVVDNAINNLDRFCETSENLAVYGRQRCNAWNAGSERCMKSYRSTKSGPVKYSTQHRPVYYQSTNHHPPKRYQYARARDENDSANNTNTKSSDDTTTTNGRKKRSAESTTEIVETTKIDDLNENTMTTGNSEVANNKETNNEPTTKPSGGEIPGHQNRRYRYSQNGDNWDQSNVSLENLQNPRVEDRDAHRMNVRPHRLRKEHQIEPYKTIQEFEKSGSDETEIRETHKKEIKVNNDGYGMDSEHRIRHKTNNTHKTWKKLEIEDTEPTTERDRAKSEKEKRIKRKKTRVNSKRDKPTKAGLSDGGAPRTVHLSKGNREFYTERMWPTRVVPYTLPESKRFDIDDVRKRLGEVNRILQKKTCVKIKEITEGEAKDYEDYLTVDTSPDYVTGRVGGKQNFGSIDLLQGGQHRQHAAMVVMAMLGFYFEVSRHDRDEHIRVHMRHIRPDKLHHFEKIRDDATLKLPYDYYSATHPAWQFWRKIGKSGISSVATLKEHDLDGSIMKLLGQNTQLLSDTDIIKINSIYGIECFLPNARHQPVATVETDGRTQGPN